MIQAVPKNLSFQEYLNYEDGTDNRYQLAGGKLAVMAQPTGQHAAIAEFLNDEFRTCIKQLKLPLVSKQSAMSIRFL